MAVPVVALALLSALVVGCAFGGPDLQATADQFDAPSSWQTIDDTEVVETLCIGPDCKTIVMAWGAGSAPTAASFSSSMQKAGWEDIEINDCEVRSDISGPVPFCRATATSDDTRIELTAAGPIASESNPFRITLRVSPK